MKKTWLSILVVIVTVWVIFFVITTGKIEPTAPVTRGYLKVDSTIIQKQNIPLTGWWGFYPSELITPAIKRPPPQFIMFPGIWNNIKMDGKPLPNQGYATYRMTINVPKGLPALAVRIPDIYSSYRLYVDDSLVVERGHPDVSKELTVPNWADAIVGLPFKGGNIVLTLQIANFYHAKGGPHKTIELGVLPRILKQNRIDWALDSLTTGFILMGAFLFFSLYIFARKDKPILYFALFALTYSYRILGTGPYLLLSIFPDFNWFAAIKIEYITLVLAMALMFQYIRYLYPLEAGSWPAKILLIISGLYCAIILFTPTVFFTGLMNYYLILLVVYLSYTCYVFIAAFINKREDSEFGLLSACIAILLFLFLNLSYFKLAHETKIMLSSGYILFLFIQAIILCSRFAESFQLSAKQAQLGITAKEEFLSTMSHEIRTPLNTIVGLVHILLKEKPSITQKETLRLVLFSANNLVKLVNDILDFTKLTENKMQLEKIDFCIKEIASNILIGEQSFAQSKNLRLELEFDEKMPAKVVGDPVRITQVITNLMHNAIKFTEEGAVTLSIQCNAVTTYAAKITISVKDTGIGIPEDKQDLIFNRFTQADSSTSRKYGGTGLGLAICQRILKLYGSKLNVISKEGEGAEFYFSLSLPIAKQNTAPASVTLDDNPLANYTILLAEDNRLNALITQKILGNFGAEVDIVSDGKQAVEKYDPELHQAIVMDVNMPEMDGFEATKIIRSMGATIPIIALTANLAQEIETKAIECGITSIVVKPFDPEKLCKAILGIKD